MHKQKKIDAGYVRVEEEPDVGVYAISRRAIAQLRENAASASEPKLGKAAKFYKPANGFEQCHETQVDHVLSRITKQVE